MNTIRNAMSESTSSVTPDLPPFAVAESASLDHIASASAPPARTLLDVFDAAATRFGRRPAIDAPDGALSYEELADAASALAGRLAARGIGPRDRVGVRVPSGTAELYVAILGVLRSGAAYVPIDADDPDSRARDLLACCGACAVVREGLRVEELPPAVRDRLRVEELPPVVRDRLRVEELPPARGRVPQPRVDDDAWIIFTSGSTGAPKGVAVTHRAAAAFVDAEAQLWSVRPDDRVLAGLSVGFDASCEEIWLAWRAGGTLVPAPRALVRAGAELGPWLEQQRVSVVSTVPTLASMWDERTLASVRLLILGGEACPEGLAWRLSAKREVWNTYGPTEATVVSTARRIRPREPVTIGWPLNGWRVAVLDEDSKPVAMGEPGELAIAGVGLARYIDPALDSQRFAPLEALGWERAYRTGDIVRETIDGLQFIGRRDDQVKIGGRRIELGEIDACLSAAPGVRAAVSAVQRSSAGNSVLVGYVAGEVDPVVVREWAAQRLPEGMVPLVVVLQSLPVGRSGKVDRRALPWPPPSTRGASVDEGLEGTATWLAERWVEQLGPVPVGPDSDFFALGGSSLSAAKLVSSLRERFPAVAVADVYNHRRLNDLSARLEQLQGGPKRERAGQIAASRRGSAGHLAALLGLIALGGPSWVIGTLAIDRIFPGGIGPQVGWGWLVAGWALFGTGPGHALLLAAARRVLLHRVKDGRHSRHRSVGLRIWALERLGDVFQADSLGGTPWAARYARLMGHEIGEGARLGTMPSPASFVRVGAEATIEDDVDMRGWWIEGSEIVIGKVQVGARARVGTRTLLMPGAVVGDGAEIEPGSVVTGKVPEAERWAGSPARQTGTAGEGWPARPPQRAPRSRMWKALYGVSIFARALPVLLAAVPGIVLLVLIAPAHPTVESVVLLAALWTVPSTASFVLLYAVIVALSVRGLSRLLRPGWHPGDGGVGFGLWLSESLMSDARDILFPLYSSIYTRAWLALAGISVGRRAEVSTAVGLTALTSLGDLSFSADDVVFAAARSRDGWLHLAPIKIGQGSFLGNGAILTAGTSIGLNSLIGVQTTPPPQPQPGTCWLGSPALELPRTQGVIDAARTTDPPLRLVIARGLMDLVRILLPACVSTGIGILAFWGLDVAGTTFGAAFMLLAAPPLLLGAGVLASLVTIVLKWVLIGRYRAGEHPLWSFFVWRDEILNSCQEQLAGAWLLDLALGSPLMPLYLRLMGAKVGKDVWCETLTITEFELASLGDGCAVNRHSVVETHLFHDRLMRIGPVTIGAGATLGPSSATLPETTIGESCSVGGRSIVMRGERLPIGTRWHGAPVAAV